MTLNSDNGDSGSIICAAMEDEENKTMDTAVDCGTERNADKKKKERERTKKKKKKKLNGVTRAGLSAPSSSISKKGKRHRKRESDRDRREKRRKSGQLRKALSTYPEQLSQLRDMGLDYPLLSASLLHRNDGNVDKVMKKLIHRDEYKCVQKEARLQNCIDEKGLELLSKQEDMDAA